MSDPPSPDRVPSGLASAVGMLLTGTDSSHEFMSVVDRRFDEADREGRCC